MCLAQLVSTLLAAYERLQVELHGKYSIERVTALYAFQQSYSIWESIVILLVTPLPCLAIIVLTDVVPLNDPSEGYAKNTVCFARYFCVGFAISITILEQARHFVPGLPLSTRTLWLTSATSMLITTIYAYFMAALIGFPIPFAIIVCAPCHLAAFVAIGFFLWRDILRRSARIRHAMIAYFKIMMTQLSLTLIYPAYNSIFMQLSGYEQTAFALVLPVLKLVAKNVLNSVCLPMLEDLKPDLVIFNAEIFHALFVGYCMQSSTSWTTTIVLMIVDAIHAWFGLRDVAIMLRSIEAMETTLCVGDIHPNASVDRLTRPLIEKAMHYEGITYDKSICFQHVSPLSTHLTGVYPIPTTSSQSTTLAPSSSIKSNTLLPPTDIPNLTLGKHTTVNANHERIEYVTQILRLLHLTECLLLVELVEVIVPVIYSAYLIAMFFLPNRIYYRQLDHMNTHSLLSTIGKTFVYAILEFLSFVIISFALKRKLGISPMHQVAFVIRTQWTLVQSKLILWVAVSVQSTLVHFGTKDGFVGVLIRDSLLKLL